MSLRSNDDYQENTGYQAKDQLIEAPAYFTMAAPAPKMVPRGEVALL
jgi:hypothetical protein